MLHRLVYIVVSLVFSIGKGVPFPRGPHDAGCQVVWYHAEMLGGTTCQVLLGSSILFVCVMSCCPCDEPSHK